MLELSPTGGTGFWTLVKTHGKCQKTKLKLYVLLEMRHIPVHLRASTTLLSRVSRVYLLHVTTVTFLFPLMSHDFKRLMANCQNLLIFWYIEKCTLSYGLIIHKYIEISKCYYYYLCGYHFVFILGWWFSVIPHWDFCLSTQWRWLWC